MAELVSRDHGAGVVARRPRQLRRDGERTQTLFATEAVDRGGERLDLGRVAGRTAAAGGLGGPCRNGGAKDKGSN